MKYLLSFILFVLLWGCSNNSGVDKHLRHSGNIINVKELVREIVIDTPLIGGGARPYILDKYFILSDGYSEDNQIFLFDKKNFSYIGNLLCRQFKKKVAKRQKRNARKKKRQKKL